MSDEHSTHLCLVNLVGEESDGKLRYEFIFTENIDEVFGENFEYKPSCMVNNLSVSDEYISEVRVIRTNNRLNLIQDCCCFSVSDAYDGVVALAWTYGEGNPIVLNFGDDSEKVEEILADNNIIFEN